MSHPPLPTAFCERIRHQLDTDAAALLDALDTEAITAIRLHPRKGENPFTGTTPVPWCPQGHYLAQRPVFTADPLFHAGAYYVQEPSSMFLDNILRTCIGDPAGLRVLDLCAAPGGKSTLLASWMNGEGLLVSNEVIRSRVSILRENMIKWGYANTVTAQHDPDDFAALEEWFDLVVVDAPCSGEGLFRKDPDARKEWSEENCHLCENRQQRILQAAARALKPGGHLIYCTCTYNPGENDEQAEALVQEDFEWVTMKPDPSWQIIATRYGLAFYPHLTRGEGFYAALLRKKGEPDDRPGQKHFRSEHPAPPAALALLKPWVSDAENFSWNLIGQELIGYPQHTAQDIFYLRRQLRRTEAGLHAGSLKGKDFIPAHALALSVHLYPQAPMLPADKKTAQAFLQRLPIAPEENIADGWQGLSYHNHPLGWMKKIGMRWNNYYPMDWRIRMQIKDDNSDTGPVN